MTSGSSGPSRHVAVIGGGIAGLTAAYRLAGEPGVDVTVLEAGPSVGGKIRTSMFMGRPIDEGPDAFLTRVPWAVELVEELGLLDEVVSPATASAAVVVNGRLRTLPDGLVLGVPTRLWPLLRSGVVSPAGALRAGMDRIRPANAPAGAESVGDLVRRRLGDQIADRLVGPLIGSINAGDADLLDLGLAAPQLESAAAGGRSLIDGIREQRRQNPVGDGPIFHSFDGGMAVLVDRLLERLAEATILTGTAVSNVVPDGAGYRVERADSTSPLAADDVVVATPAFVAAELLRETSPTAARGLAAIDYASVALVTMGLRRSDVQHGLEGSGMLVPAPEGLLTTACSWGSSKWPHWADDDTVVLRASAGRHRDERALSLDDDELVETVLGELAPLLGIDGPLLEWRISRYPRSFPQYAPGHGARVDAIEAALRSDAPGVIVTGAAYRGLGIPACIRQGAEAAEQVLDGVRQH